MLASDKWVIKQNIHSIKRIKIKYKMVMKLSFFFNILYLKLFATQLKVVLNL